MLNDYKSYCPECRQEVKPTIADDDGFKGICPIHGEVFLNFSRIGVKMSSFTTLLVTSPLPDGRHWKVMEPFEYHVGSEDSDDVISVPEDFITDYASTDFIHWLAIGLTTIFLALRVFWGIEWGLFVSIAVLLVALWIRPYGRHGKAAVLHDYIYQYHIGSSLVIDRNWQSPEKTRKEADQIFLEAMLVAKTNPVKAQLMYWGVRIFGIFSWRK